MNRCIGFLAGLAFVLASAGTAFGQADMVNTPHDLVGGGANTFITITTTPATDLCQICHVPHASQTTGNTPEVPLWNHTLSSASYSMYTSGTIGTIKASPQGVSAACLSCHDGSVALDALGGAAGTAADTITGTAWLGTDLRDDHPISVKYDLAATDLNTVASLTNVVVYNDGTDDWVECGSCHDPHNWGAVADSTFLRATRAASGLCLECHNK
jgi:predicted CXXCH cytochrome family protein